MEEIKIALVGYLSGKTSFLNRFFDGEFTCYTLPTITSDFKRKLIKLPNGEETKIKLIDTMGNERFRDVSSKYLNKSDGAILIYNITNKESFLSLPFWTEKIKL